MILLSDTLKKNVIVLTVSFAFFFVNISYGETPVSIYLRNGDRITGRWLNADNRIIKIDFNGQEMSVSLDEISSISITSNTISEKYLKNAEDLLKLGFGIKLENSLNYQFKSLLKMQKPITRWQSFFRKMVKRTMP